MKEVLAKSQHNVVGGTGERFTAHAVFHTQKKKRAYVKEEERRGKRKKNRLSLYSLSHNTL